MSAEPPSPFTMPTIKWQFVDAPIPGANGERLSWTMKQLQLQLRDFATFYMDCTAAMQSGPWYERQRAHGTREANASADQITFNAVEGMDELRTLIRVRYEMELTVGGVDRFINDVIRSAEGRLTVSQVEQMSIPQALASISRTERKSGEAEGSPSGTGASSNLPKLTDRRKLMLVEMLALGAVGEAKKTTRDAVVRRIDRKKTGADLGRDFGVLKRLGYTDSEGGTDGGVWLTASGAKKANELQAANEQPQP